ncbi:DUF7935 family protein [Flavobacterium sp. U410]
MNTDKILELAAYTLPALITGGTAFILLQKFFNNEENKRRFELLKENQKQSLPIRLQAYERLVLFLERINPVQLLLRVPGTGLNPQSYATLLVHSIQTEYEHNITQQIYVSEEAWNTVLKAKNGIIVLIRNKSITEGITNADEMRQAILTELMESDSVSDIAIAFIKEELKKVF